MPGLDGVDLAAELRRRRPGLPVLFMTGHADRDRLLGEVVVDKPFTLPTLAAALARRRAP
jgi:CheY-like chemotaxis protein